jgi:hypothetical protein
MNIFFSQLFVQFSNDIIIWQENNIIAGTALLATSIGTESSIDDSFTTAAV